ncbi:hypothetical protein JCM17380_09940 [Desulfosporosinus burensis]
MERIVYGLFNTRTYYIMKFNCSAELVKQFCTIIKRWNSSPTAQVYADMFELGAGKKLRLSMMKRRAGCLKSKLVVDNTS